MFLARSATSFLKERQVLANLLFAVAVGTMVDGSFIWNPTVDFYHGAHCNARETPLTTTLSRPLRIQTNTFSCTLPRGCSLIK